MLQNLVEIEDERTESTTRSGVFEDECTETLQKPWILRDREQHRKKSVK